MPGYSHHRAPPLNQEAPVRTLAAFPTSKSAHRLRSLGGRNFTEALITKSNIIAHSNKRRNWGVGQRPGKPPASTGWTDLPRATIAISFCALLDYLVRASFRGIWVLKGVTLAGEKLPKLVELTALLRGPNGCPWDREQDIDSLKGLLLEEAYEVVDAAGARDFDGLEDELGDLLFMVVFYAQLAEEDGRFKIDDVLKRVHAKLIRRHPHVFGDVQARTPEEALQSWLSVKEAERESSLKRAKESGSLLDGIPANLPAALEAYEIGVRAGEVGFDWKRIEDLFDKVEEELGELRRELKGQPEGKHRRLQEEVGDLLFTAANLARHVRSDPETCLRSANRKFKQRFRALEEEVAKRGKNVRECSLTELEAIWSEVKSRGKSRQVREPRK